MSDMSVLLVLYTITCSVHSPGGIELQQHKLLTVDELIKVVLGYCDHGLGRWLVVRVSSL